MALSEGGAQDRRARHGVEPVQDGRVHVEKINGPMPFELKARRLEYKAGPDLAITKAGLVLHKSGTFVRFTQAGVHLFAG
jgi:hypothetical protein